MSASAASPLTENLCNLLALASATDLGPNRMPSELQIEAMLAFCRQKLDDSELTPQRVADHLGVSVRTLHSRFKQIGQTFAEWVRDERLKACSAALRDPTQRLEYFRNRLPLGVQRPISFQRIVADAIRSHSQAMAQRVVDVVVNYPGTALEGKALAAVDQTDQRGAAFALKQTGSDSATTEQLYCSSPNRWTLLLPTAFAS